MPSTTGRFKSKRINENAPGRLFFVFMVSAAFVISGILEDLPRSNQQPLNLTVDVNQSELSGTQGRRYCDLPNMTALTIFYSLNEDTSIDYDFLSNQETIIEHDVSISDVENHKVDVFSDWGFVLSFFPACFLSSKQGPYKVFSYCIILQMVFRLVFWVADTSLLRHTEGSIFGFFLGVLLFSFYEMTFRFASSNRNILYSFASVRHLGVAIVEVLTVYQVNNQYAFYTALVVIIPWFVVWSKIQFSSSRSEVCSEEPRERRTMVLKLRTPWKDALCSRPVWMTTAAIFGASCGITCIFKVMKLYLKYVYYLKMEIMSASSRLFHIGLALLCASFIDLLTRARIVSVTSSRRMVVYVSHFIPAGLLFVLGFVGCGETTPMVLYCMAIMLTGANYTGAFSSPLDLAPKYSGSILAFCFTFGSFGSLTMDYLLSYVITKQVFVSWKFIFSLTSLILLLTAIFFMLRGSGSVQQWNDPKHKQTKQKKKTGEEEGISAAAIVLKPRTKSIYMVEKKILKVLHVQEPEKFTRVRAYSTSLPNERITMNPPNIYRPSNKKRASIS